MLPATDPIMQTVAPGSVLASRASTRGCSIILMIGVLPMPRIEFDLTTGVSPDRFIAALTDFSPARADLWPNIDSQHLKVHEVGPDWADVTEGSSLAGGVWERNRYDWSTAGTVRVETAESNTWRPGSFWLYR